MKTSPLKHTLFVLLFIVFGSSSIIAQVDFKEPLDAYFIPKFIKKAKVKSLVIYSLSGLIPRGLPRQILLFCD